MKQLFIIAFVLVATLQGFSQETRETPLRKGFTIGGSAGIGVIHFTKGMEGTKTFGDLSLPNLKIGWFANENLAFYLNTTGMIYESNGLDRSFEGIIPTVQYYTSDRMWLSGGVGAALDTRAFYESNSKSDKNYWGKGVLLSSGYEFKQREKWAMDLQARVYMAGVDRDELENLEGSSFTLSFGFTFY